MNAPTRCIQRRAFLAGIAAFAGCSSGPYGGGGTVTYKVVARLNESKEVAVVVDRDHPDLQQLQPVQEAISDALQEDVGSVTVSESTFKDIRETFLSIAERQGVDSEYNGRELAVRTSEGRVVVNVRSLEPA